MFLNKLFHKNVEQKKSNPELSFNLPDLVVDEWITRENPYRYMTDNDKRIIKKIGTSLNIWIRKNLDLPPNIQSEKDLFDRLLTSSVLNEEIIIYRGVKDLNYEISLAEAQGYDNNHLYYNGYVYCTLTRGVYFNGHHVKMIITVPAGTHYLFTGEYSNVPESNEFILDIGTVFRVDRKEEVNDSIYIWVSIVN